MPFIAFIFLLSCNTSTEPNKVADPIFTPPGGNYGQDQQVSLSCATYGAEIRYTTDGSTPPANSTVYSAPFVVELGTTVRAIATKAGMEDSDVVSAFYTSTVEDPMIAPAAGTYFSTQSVTMSCPTAGAEIRYTYDGSEPTESSYLYATPFVVSETMTIKARAFMENWTPSQTVAAAYEIHIPQIVGSYTTPVNALGVDVSGDYACLALGGNGLRILYVGDPSNPSMDGAGLTADDTIDIFMAGDHAYVADDDQGLTIVDISEPWNAFICDTCPLPGEAWDVWVQGDYAYVAARTHGLHVVNVSDPMDPYLAGSCSLGSNAKGVTVSGSYAYVADGEFGLRVINVSNPGNPFLVGSCATDYHAIEVFVSGSYAYVADSFSGLQIVNVANPADPYVIGSCDTPGEAHDVKVSGDYAFVTDKFTGLQIINVADPSNPDLVGSFPTPGQNAVGLALQNGYAYVADGFGFRIVDLDMN